MQVCGARWQLSPGAGVVTRLAVYTLRISPRGRSCGCRAAQGSPPHHPGRHPSLLARQAAVEHDLPLLRHAAEVFRVLSAYACDGFVA